MKLNHLILSLFWIIYSVYSLALLAKLTNSSNGNLDQNVVNFTVCTTQDFQDHGQCSLTCTAKSQNLYEWHWIYYINTTSDNVTIFEGVNRTDFSDSTQITLTLANYSAGYYQCWYHYINNDSGQEFASWDFQIDPIVNGVPLDDPCHSSTECLSLDATCNNTCQCVRPYLYTMDTLACLKGVGPFQPCNIDEQCRAAGENYNCSNSICDCMATYTYVGEVNQYLCLLPVPEDGSCQYEEECTLTDPYLWCENNICLCRDDYYFNNTMNYCINGSTTASYSTEDNGLSFGAIIGIIVGSSAAVVILFAVIGLVMLV